MAKAEREPTEVAIYGGRGFAREVNELIKACHAVGTATSAIGFIVDPAYFECSVMHDLPVHRSIDWLKNVPNALVVIAIGATAARLRIAGEIEDALGPRFATLVHPRASLGTSVSIGPGTIVCAGATASSDISIGRHGQVHAGASVGHDDVLGDFVTVAPGAVVSGRVVIGDGTFVGAGAVILPDVTVGSWTTIGAGAVVTRDVPDSVTVMGVPARTSDNL